MNRIVQEVLRHYVSPRADNWDRLLPLVEFAINSAKQESTGFSPFQLNYGRNPSSPLDREFDEVLPRANFYKVFPKCPTAKEYHDQWRSMLSRARSLLKKAQDRQKAYVDKKRAQVPQGISVGKKVLLSTENLRLLIVGSQKFMPRYIGPFLVKEESHRAAFRLVSGDLASRPNYEMWYLVNDKVRS